MQFDHEPGSGNHIQSYDEQTGSVIIHGEKYSHSIIVTANSIIDWDTDGITDVSKLSEKHFEALLHIESAQDEQDEKNGRAGIHGKDQNIIKPEVVIVGCGNIMRFPSQAIYGYFIERHIGLEIMTTGSACRTYNLLVADERSVVVGLLV